MTFAAILPCILEGIPQLRAQLALADPGVTAAGPINTDFRTLLAAEPATPAQLPVLINAGGHGLPLEPPPSHGGTLVEHASGIRLQRLKPPDIADPPELETVPIARAWLTTDVPHAVPLIEDGRPLLPAGVAVPHAALPAPAIDVPGRPEPRDREQAATPPVVRAWLRPHLPGAAAVPDGASPAPAADVPCRRDQHRREQPESRLGASTSLTSAADVPHMEAPPVRRAWFARDVSRAVPSIQDGRPLLPASVAVPHGALPAPAADVPGHRDRHRREQPETRLDASTWLTGEAPGIITHLPEIAVVPVRALRAPVTDVHRPDPRFREQSETSPAIRTWLRPNLPATAVLADGALRASETPPAARERLNTDVPRGAKLVHDGIPHLPPNPTVPDGALPSADIPAAARARLTGNEPRGITLAQDGGPHFRDLPTTTVLPDGALPAPAADLSGRPDPRLREQPEAPPATRAWLRPHLQATTVLPDGALRAPETGDVPRSISLVQDGGPHFRDLPATTVLPDGALPAPAADISGRPDPPAARPWLRPHLPATAVLPDGALRALDTPAVARERLTGDVPRSITLVQDGGPHLPATTLVPDGAVPVRATDVSGRPDLPATAVLSDEALRAPDTPAAPRARLTGDVPPSISLVQDAGPHLQATTLVPAAAVPVPATDVSGRPDPPAARAWLRPHLPATAVLPDGALRALDTSAAARERLTGHVRRSVTLAQDGDPHLQPTILLPDGPLRVPANDVPARPDPLPREQPQTPSARASVPAAMAQNRVASLTSPVDLPATAALPEGALPVPANTFILQFPRAPLPSPPARDMAPSLVPPMPQPQIPNVAPQLPSRAADPTREEPLHAKSKQAVDTASSGGMHVGPATATSRQPSDNATAAEQERPGTASVWPAPNLDSGRQQPKPTAKNADFATPRNNTSQTHARPAPDHASAAMDVNAFSLLTYPAADVAPAQPLTSDRPKIATAATMPPETVQFRDTLSMGQLKHPGAPTEVAFGARVVEKQPDEKKIAIEDTFEGGGPSLEQYGPDEDRVSCSEPFVAAADLRTPISTAAPRPEPRPDPQPQAQGPGRDRKLAELTPPAPESANVNAEPTDLTGGSRESVIVHASNAELTSAEPAHASVHAPRAAETLSRGLTAKPSSHAVVDEIATLRPAASAIPNADPRPGPAPFSHAPTTRTESPEPVRPHATVAAEIPAPAPRTALPLRDVTVRLTSETQRVDVKLSERGGELHVSVQSADPALTSDLRASVHDLIGGLDKSGFHTDTWQPGDTPRLHSATHGSASQGGNPPMQSGQDPRREGRNPYHPEYAPSRRSTASSTAWMEQMSAVTGAEMEK